jgi:hypothetical protein
VLSADASRIRLDESFVLPETTELELPTSRRGSSEPRRRHVSLGATPSGPRGILKMPSSATATTTHPPRGRQQYEDHYSVDQLDAGVEDRQPFVPPAAPRPAPTATGRASQKDMRLSELLRMMKLLHESLELNSANLDRYFCAGSPADLV